MIRDERQGARYFSFHLNSVYVDGSDGVVGDNGTSRHYNSVVLLYGRDNTGEDTRIRVWTEFAAIGHPARSEADRLAVRVAHDLLRNAIRPIILSIGLNPVDSRWYPKIDPFRFDFSYVHKKPRPVRRDNGMLRDVCELTSVFWRGDNELWATASTQGQFSANMKKAQREYMLTERCKALFESAANLEPEYLLARIAPAPEGVTDTTCF